MEPGTIFLASFAIALSGAVAPGPVLAAVISRSVTHGPSAGPRIICGHALLEMLAVTLLALGVGRVAVPAAALKTLEAIGAALLLWMGIGILCSARRADLNAPPPREKSSGLFWTGVTLSLTNPYWSLWWGGLGLGMVLGARQYGFGALVAFYLGHILADFLWYSAVSYAVHRGKNFISNRLYRALLALCGVVLVAFGVYFALLPL